MHMASDQPGLLMRRQLLAQFQAHGEEEAHGWSGRSHAEAPQYGAHHPFATEAMCLEMTYGEAGAGDGKRSGAEEKRH